MFEAAGLVEVGSRKADQVAERGSVGFEEMVELWPRVIDNIGQKLILAEYIDKDQLQSAKISFEEFSKNTLKKQVLSMRSVVGGENLATEISGVLLGEFIPLLWQIVEGEDRRDGADRNASTTVDALYGVYVKHLFGFKFLGILFRMDAIHRAGVYTS